MPALMTSSISKQRMIQFLTAPNVYVSPLLTAILVHATFNFSNALLLSPLASNQVRCTPWKKSACSPDDEWILNWLAFFKGYAAVLLASVALSVAHHSSTTAGSTVWMEAKLGFLSVTLAACQLNSIVINLPQLEAPLAFFQALLLVLLILVTLFWTSQQEMQPGSAYLARPYRSRTISLSGSSSLRRKIYIPTVVLGLQAAASTFRILPMALGSFQNDDYLGDETRYVGAPLEAKSKRNWKLHIYV